MNKIIVEKSLRYIVQVIFLSIILMLLYSSCRSDISSGIGGYTYSKTSFLLNVLFIIAAYFVMGGAYWLIHSRLHITVGRKAMIAVTILNAAFMLLFIMNTQLAPLGDQLDVMDAAAALARGDNSDWLEEGYMFFFPFQNGIVLALYFVTLLFGEGRYVLLQLLNAVFMLVLLYALYRTLKLMKIGENAARWIYVLMPLWFPLTMYVTYIYGIIVGLMFAMLAVMFMYKYFDSKKLRYMLVSSVCMAISAVLKQNYLIIMIAMIIMLIYHGIHISSWKPLINIIPVIVFYIFLSASVDYTVEKLTGVDTPKGTPKSAWVAMGITADEGWYNGYNQYVYVKNGYDYSATKEECNDYIRKRIEFYIDKPRIAAEYFKKKIKVMWEEPTFECFEIQSGRDSNIEIPDFVKSCIGIGERLNNRLWKCLNAAKKLIYAGTALYIVVNWRKPDLYRLLFAIVFIGGFLFHIAWEVKSQYGVSYFFLIIPYAIRGWADAALLLTSKISKIRRKNACENA